MPALDDNDEVLEAVTFDFTPALEVGNRAVPDGI